MARYTCSRHSITPREICRTSVTCGWIWKGRQQHMLNSVIPIHFASDAQHAAQGRTPAPTHPGNSERPWQRVGAERTTSAPWKEDLSLQLLFGDIVHQTVQSLMYKPSIAWFIDAFNVSIMWLRASHWCEYELLNKVCDSKREYARGHFNIFRANFIFRFYAFS